MDIGELEGFMENIKRVIEESSVIKYYCEMDKNNFTFDIIKDEIPCYEMKLEFNGRNDINIYKKIYQPICQEEEDEEEEVNNEKLKEQNWDKIVSEFEIAVDYYLNSLPVFSKAKPTKYYKGSFFGDCDCYLVGYFKIKYDEELILNILENL